MTDTNTTNDISNASVSSLPCSSAIAANDILTSMFNKSTENDYFDISKYSSDKEENISYIKTQIRDGLDIDDLEEDEKKYLEEELGKDWATIILGVDNKEEDTPKSEDIDDEIDAKELWKTDPIMAALLPHIKNLPVKEQTILFQMLEQGVNEETVKLANSNPIITNLFAKLKGMNLEEPEILE